MFEIICIAAIFAVTLAFGVVIYIEEKRVEKFEKDKTEYQKSKEDK